MSVTNMSLRQYYAGQAMAGDWAAQGRTCGVFGDEVSDEGLYERAKLYVRMADALIAAEAAAPYRTFSDSSPGSAVDGTP